MYNEYRVISVLDATSEGPMAKHQDETEQLVHLHQGDLDGACGPYAVLMGLLALGLVKRDDVTGWGAVDRRTTVGKLIARMSEGHSTLFREGTNLRDLTNLVGEIFRTNLEVIPFDGSGVDCRSFVHKHILAGNPVVLGLQWEDKGHWVLVIGLAVHVDGTERKWCRFLILDPSQLPALVCPWNGIIDTRGGGGRYPYTWWTDGIKRKTKVAFDSAMALVARRGGKLRVPARSVNSIGQL